MKLNTLLILIVLVASLLSCSRSEMYESCPSFKEEDSRIVGQDEVTLHPSLVEDTIEAIKRELRNPYTIERLEIAEAGEAIEVTVTDTGSGDRLTGPRHELRDGSELYYNIHLWGSARFENSSEVRFHVWAHPIPSGRECAIRSVALQPSSFVPI